MGAMVFAAPDVTVQVALAVAAVALGYGVCMFVEYRAKVRRRARADAQLEEARGDAERTLTVAVAEARAHATRIREAARDDLDDYRETLGELERRLDERDGDLDGRDDDLRAKRAEVDVGRRDVRSQEFRIREARRAIAAERTAQRARLLELCERDEDVAVASFLADLDAEVSREMTRYLERSTERLADEVDAYAREIVDRVTQRMDLNHAREERSFVVSVDAARLETHAFTTGSDAWSAFEAATGVELALDAGGESIVVNSIDGVRREAARRALECALALASPESFTTKRSAGRSRGRGGRGRGGKRRGRSAETFRAVPPEEYEALYTRVRGDLDAALVRAGRRAMQALRLDADAALFPYLGRLQYRTSYGQNILKHSQEVGLLGGLLGAEGGFDEKLSKRCSFLHDVGKGLDHEREGGHPAIGADIAQTCGEDETVINAIAAHHEDVPRTSLYPLLVQAADAISGARPGARRRTTEAYNVRMGQIEEIASARPGVEGVYVIQAGREVRVILDAKKTSDADAGTVAESIARELENEVQFPGTIRVTVIRERRISTVAH